ncbi:MAG: MliC family protein [Nitrosomonas sp.]|jgi:membrane-bound inhibitor of C-type lysozyme|nr:MliC family protein [Nitrosomonas sp.]
MKLISLIMTYVLLIAGCTAMAESNEPGDPLVVQFKCTNGEQVEMRFFRTQGVGVLVRAGKTVELQQKRSASGFWYSNGPHTVRGKGNEITIEIGRMMPIHCTAV